LLGPQNVVNALAGDPATETLLVPLQAAEIGVDQRLQECAQQPVAWRLPEQAARYAFNAESLGQVEGGHLPPRLVLRATEVEEGVEAEETDVSRIRIAVGVGEVRHDDFEPGSWPGHPVQLRQQFQETGHVFQGMP